MTNDKLGFQIMSALSKQPGPATFNGIPVVRPGGGLVFAADIEKGDRMCVDSDGRAILLKRGQQPEIVRKADR